MHRWPQLLVPSAFLLCRVSYDVGILAARRTARRNACTIVPPSALIRYPIHVWDVVDVGVIRSGPVKLTGKLGLVGTGRLRTADAQHSTGLDRLVRDEDS